MKKQTYFVGSYNRRPFGSGEGICRVQYDAQAGALEQKEVCTETDNPSFLAQRGDTLLAAQELLDHGCIASYRLQDGALRRVAVRDMPGGLMCHLNVWPDGRTVSAANYWTGSLAVCPLAADGTVGEPAQLLQYDGKGTDPQRQEGPHTHSSCTDPSGRWLVVAELGLDRIWLYRLDEKNGRLVSSPVMPYAEAPAGYGPRHFAFHPDGHHLYVSAELKSSVLVYQFDAERGILTLQQTLSALPADFSGTNLTADIHLSADGRYCYASNRGHDSIAVFAVQADGGLKAAGHFSCGGEEPRSFCMVPQNRMMIANQNSGSVVLCQLDSGTGLLEKVLATLEIPSAVYILPWTE